MARLHLPARVLRRARSGRQPAGRLPRGPPGTGLGAPGRGGRPGAQRDGLRGRRRARPAAHLHAHGGAAVRGTPHGRDRLAAGGRARGRWRAAGARRRAARPLRGRRDVRLGAPRVGARVRVGPARLAGRRGGARRAAARARPPRRVGVGRRGRRRVRARVFPVRYGIAEDEATGAAAAILCARLERAIEIRQGRGSRIRRGRWTAASWRWAARPCSTRCATPGLRPRRGRGS